MSVDINKAVGCLVGLAAGDRNGGPLGMALALTDSIIDKDGKFDTYNIGRRYLRLWRRTSGYDLGWTSNKVFKLVSSGMSFESASIKVHRDSDELTAGIAPAHRALPLALMPYAPAPNDIRYVVKKEAQLTHIHHLATDISVIVVRICQSLINDSTVDYDSIVKFYTSKTEFIPSGTHCVPDEKIVTYPYYASSIDKLNTGGYAPSVLTSALYFLRNANTFEEALNNSIEFAGANNYCPVLVGAIGGARWGVESIPSNCTEHLGNLLGVIKDKAESLATIKRKKIGGKYYPLALESIMEKVHKIIELTNDSDLSSITKIKIDKARNYEYTYSSYYELYKLIFTEKGLKIPQFSILKFSAKQYHDINYDINKYVKLLTRDETVSLIIGLIEAENQQLYFTGSTSGIYKLFIHLKKRGYDRFDELEEWAFQYSTNSWVPTGSCGGSGMETISVAENYEMRVADQKATEKAREDKAKKLEKQKRDNAIKQAKMRERQAKNSKYRDELIIQLEYFTPYEKLIVISGNGMGMPPYYFPIHLVDNITDEEIRKIPEDVKQQMISRIQHFDKLHNRTTKMMRPWYEFSYRLIGKRPGSKPKLRMYLRWDYLVKYLKKKKVVKI